jgi:ankyrin repeat protein
MANQDDSLPLHVACSFSSPSLEIVQYLVAFEPESVLLSRTSDGTYPLPVALDHVIEFLFNLQDSEAIMFRNSAGETPLHVACRRGAS